MGYRTVVVFNNDQTHEWEKDPELGQKIRDDMFRRANERYTPLELIGGRVVECVHADVQTLAAFDGYDGFVLAHSHWVRGETPEQRQLKLLKELANKLGYRVSKLPVRKA